MATQEINQIDYDGVTYKFVDEDAQETILALTTKYGNLNSQLESEVSRAQNVEATIQSHMPPYEAGKVLTTNDFTDYYKDKIDAIVDMNGATATTDGTGGLVPKPAAGDQDKYLSGSGEWIGNATKTASGTMSAFDKSKMDLMDPDGEEPYTCTITDAGVSMAYGNGKMHSIVFNDDGTINETITTSNGDVIRMLTEFDNGTITRTEVQS